MTKLSGVVIVTGAASGLGREAARHFAQCGAKVAAVDMNRAGLEAIASGSIHPIVADLTKASECRMIAEKAAGLGAVSSASAQSPSDVGRTALLAYKP